MFSILTRHSLGRLIGFGIVLTFLFVLIMEPPIGALRFINPVGRYIFLAAMTIFLVDLALTRGWIKHRPVPRWISTIDRRYVWAAASVCVFTLCFLVLQTSWTNGGPQDYSAIGGLVPFNDAAAYFEGAEHLLQDGSLTNFSERRPLNVAFFAARLLIANENIYVAIILQAIVAALALVLASHQMYRLQGGSIALVFFAINFAFLNSCLPRTLSEPLGISLGLIAFTLYCSSINRRSTIEYSLATLILTLALLARAGAMFALVASVLFALLFFANSWKARCSAVVLTLAAIDGGWLINVLLVKLYGTGGAMLSNFSYVLYGLSQGGKSWLQAVQDFPHLSGNEQQMAALLYQKSIETILSDPLLLIGGIIKTLWKSLVAFPIDLLTLLGNASDGGLPDSRAASGLAAAFLIPPLLYGAWRLAFRRPFMLDPLQLFVVLQLVGFLASLPFFYLDGRLRLTAATFPFTAAAIVMILSACKAAPYRERIMLVRGNGFYAGTLAMFIILASLAAPKINLMRPAQSGLEPVTCEAADMELRMLVGTGTAHVNIRDDDTESRLPNIRRSDFRVSNHSEIEEFWKTLNLPATILLGLDSNSRRAHLIVGPLGFADGSRRLTALCAKPLNGHVLSYRPARKDG